MAVLAVAALAVVTAAGRAQEDSAGAVKKTPGVRIAMVQSLFRGAESSAMLAQTAPFSELLYTQTGIRAQFCIRADGAEICKQINDGELELGILHGIDFAWVMKEYPDLRPLVLAYNQTIKLKAYLLVRDDSDIKSVADLKGKPFSFPRRSLNHCYLFTHKTIVEAGLEPAGFFAATANPSNTEAGLDAVVDGKSAATVVDGVALELYKGRKPGRANKLRVLCESDLFPTATFIYKPSQTDPAMVKQFRDGMVTAHERIVGRQMLTLWRLSNFGDVPAEYDGLLGGVLKDYPRPVRPAVFVADPEKKEGDK